MPFAKLDSSITESSLWSEDLHVRIVFLSFIARKDETGFVSGARSGLIRVCNVTAEQFDDAILKLSSPDTESKTPDFEGRRIAKADGGYVVLNSDKYRLPEDTKKENHRIYMQKWREEKESVNSREITKIHNGSPSVSESVSVSVSKKEIEVKHRYGEYNHVLLTDAQHDKLISDFGKERLELMIKKLDEYIQMKGAKYKDHNLTMRNWENKNGGGKLQPQTELNLQAPKIKVKHIPQDHSIIMHDVIKAWPEGTDYDYYPHNLDRKTWLWMYIKLFHEKVTQETIAEIKMRLETNV